MLKCFFGLIILLQASQALADTCSDIVKLHNEQQLLAAKLLQNQMPLYSVVICKEKDVPVYAQFYTYIHLDKHQYGVPKGGLTQVKIPLKAFGKTTGVLTAGPQKQHIYSLKFRTRFESSDFIDVAETFTLRPDTAVILNKDAYTMGVVRAPIFD